VDPALRCLSHRVGDTWPRGLPAAWCARSPRLGVCVAELSIPADAVHALAANVVDDSGITDEVAMARRQQNNWRIKRELPQTIVEPGKIIAWATATAKAGTTTWAGGILSPGRP